MVFYLRRAGRSLDLTVDETAARQVLRRSRQSSGASVHLYLATLLSLDPECTSAFLVDHCSAIVAPCSLYSSSLHLVLFEQKICKSQRAIVQQENQIHRVTGLVV